jgi:hypothetical protein
MSKNVLGFSFLGFGWDLEFGHWDLNIYSLNLMVNLKLKKLFFVFLPVLFGLFFCLPNFGFASTAEGVIDSGSKYAWSNKIGWISFNTTGAGSIKVTDTALTGYAWSKNFGWINLGPAGSGVKNNGSGSLSGYAWGQNVGWINFNGVTINSVGQFTGRATGTFVGEINFDCDSCKVITDWRTESARGGGGLSGGAYSAPVATAVSFTINNGQAITSNLNVSLSLTAGIDVASMAISNSENFENVTQESFQKTKTWQLLPGDGQKTVYVKFYTQYGQPSQTLQSIIILDTTAPELAITKSQASYKSTEDVVVGGTTEANAKVELLIDKSYYSEFTADSQGSWLITLGKYSAGSHHLEFTPKDSVGNKGKAVAFDFSVTGEVEVPTTQPQSLPEIIGGTLSPLLDRVQNQLNALLPNIVKPTEIKPTEVVVISQITPVSLSTAWELLPSKQISEFVLAPLPGEIGLIAQKFPEVQKTFAAVGIKRVTDVSKLQSTTFKLPGVTQTTGISQVELRTGEFTPAKGIPIAQLTSTAKSKIPSEIIFSKAGGGLIDFNTALSINTSGNTEQRITTITGKTVQFVVKVDSPAKSVKGYLTFKSKKPEAVSYNVSLNDMAASLLFAAPDLAVEPTITATTLPEQKLVVKEFDYINTGDGVYTADVEMPVVSGEYEVMTIVDYKDPTLAPKEMNLITVVDPEGYVYEKSGDKETRISGAIASLYWLNPATKQYELWPAKSYQQENPQVTDVTGNYSFLVPEGYYYLKVDAPGYLSYDGKPFQVTEGSGVHINIELKTKYWWLDLLDWKTALLVIALFMLAYNFYRDRIRDSVLQKK